MRSLGHTATTSFLKHSSVPSGQPACGSASAHGGNGSLLVSLALRAVGVGAFVGFLSAGLLVSTGALSSGLASAGLASAGLASAGGVDAGVVGVAGGGVVSPSARARAAPIAGAML